MIERINGIHLTWNLKGVIDDDETMWEKYEDGYPVIGGCEWLSEIKNAYCVCAIGSARARKIIIDKLVGKVNFATVIDPNVVISKRAEIGEGCIICAGTIITVNVKIAHHVIINLDCIVGHDTVIRDFVTIYPIMNVSGNVEVGRDCELGTGMQIIQGTKIGKETIVGAGAVVKDLPEKCTVVGNPAKPIKFFK